MVVTGRRYGARVPAAPVPPPVPAAPGPPAPGRVAPPARPGRRELAAALVFPARCPGCGVPAEPACAACLAAVPRAPAAPPPPGIDAWVAPFAYRGVVREVITRAKYRDRHAALPWLARAMAGAWWAADLPPPDAVTWVPAAPARRRARGVDHARRLATGVAGALGVPAVALLVRRDPQPQTGRGLDARRAGPDVGLRPGSARRVVPGRLLLVDDVATTGATLRVCAAVLRAAGVASVVACTGARTPGRG